MGRLRRPLLEVGESLQGPGGVRRARRTQLLRTRTHGRAAPRPHGRRHARVEAAGRRRAVGVRQVVARARRVAPGAADGGTRRLRIMVHHRPRARCSPIRRSSEAALPPGGDRTSFGPRRAGSRKTTADWCAPPQASSQDEETELVLLIDQFEELFTLTATSAERAAFLEALRVACDDRGAAVRVIVTLRADFYDRPLAYRGFGAFVAERTEAVLPLAPDELERAIDGPAERVGVGARARTCRGDRRRRRRPARRAPAAAVRAHRAVRAPRRRDDDADGLCEDRRRDRGARHAGRPALRAARRRRDGDASASYSCDSSRSARGPRTPGAASRAPSSTRSTSIPRLVDGVIDAFGHHRILTFDREATTREPTIEIAHEALIPAWERPPPRGSSEGREDVRTRIGAWWRASRSGRRERDTRSCSSGARLERLSSWLSETHLALARREREFVDQSMQRQEAEAAADRARIEEERALERRSIRRLRGLVAALAAASLLAASLAVIAVDRGGAAERRSEEARSRGSPAARSRPSTRIPA